MIFIKRNNQEFGPYDEFALLTYVNAGQILKNDIARNDVTNEVKTVSFFLKEAGLKPKVSHKGNIFTQLKSIGSELIFPKTTMLSKSFLTDQRFLGLPKFGVMDVLSCKLIRYSILFFANSLVINNVLYYKL